jgi:hypothetical protein
VFRDRSAVEIIVLLFTVTVSATLLLTGAAIVVIELANPAEDTSGAANALLNVISGVIGALLGLLAGKVESGGSVLSRRPGDE